ncbi:MULTISPECIES: hypothetical protein [unclassified Sphingomonas]|jgi:hypothetical protein|uniref:hypothetical protein n=1 Tax=unclassified Sphingomonas TaxID=196159 RepID=UPI000AD56127|nr:MULTISPECIES: hypothetical protein [unclassified Sphingomonas]
MTTLTPPSTAKLRLFTSPAAFPNPQRLRIFLHEKRIADRFDEQSVTWHRSASSGSGSISR